MVPPRRGDPPPRQRPGRLRTCAYALLPLRPLWPDPLRLRRPRAPQPSPTSQHGCLSLPAACAAMDFQRSRRSWAAEFWSPIQIRASRPVPSSTYMWSTAPQGPGTARQSREEQAPPSGRPRNGSTSRRGGSQRRGRCFDGPEEGRRARCCRICWALNLAPDRFATEQAIHDAF